MSATSEISTYRRLFTEQYADIAALLADLPAEALLWKPFEQSPWQGPCSSIGLIVAHSVSSTVYLLRRAEWILGRIEWSQVDGDEGKEEFSAANHDLGYLQARVQRNQEFVNRFLDTLSPADLDSSRAHPKRTDRLFTVRYDIEHAFEHMSRHLGQGQLTRQLWTLAAK